MVDSTLAFNLIARDRGASSVFDKVARQADKTSAALSKTSKISDSVAKAEARLTKAHDAESDALDKVHLAETKLAEIRNNAKSKTSQIVAAENALASARRNAARASSDVMRITRESIEKTSKDVEEETDRVGHRSGKSFGAGFKRWFKGEGGGLFAQIGKNGGTVFGSGLLGAIKTPILGPAILATVAGAVATAAPAVGAVVSSGVVAGFGAGLGALGIVFAAKSAEVQNAWKKTLAGMGADMRVLSKPFEQTLLGMAVVAKRTFNAFKPALSAAFKTIAPAISAFGDQAGRAFEKLAPAIRPMSDAFAAVARTLGPAMQDAMGKVTDSLIKLADSVKKSPDGLADLVRGMGDVARATIDVIRLLNDVNQKFKDLTGASAVSVVMTGVAGAIKGSELALRGLTAPITLAHGLMGKLGIKTKDAGASTDTFSSNLTSAIDQIKKGSQPAETLAQKFDRQWAATQRLNQQLFRTSNLLLTLSGSEIGYQEAVDNVTASIKENGRTHDINTAKGRANQRALLDLASAANSQTEAMRNSGSSSVQAARHGDEARRNFVKLAVQMGYSRVAAEQMARKMIAIPNVSREAKLTANKADLDAKLAKAKAQLADPKLTATKKAQLKAEIAQLLAAKRQAQAAIDSLRGKTVTIRWDSILTGKLPPVGGIPKSLQARAAGGPVKKGVPYVVGEKRPELFVPKQDGTILPKVPRSTKGAAYAGRPVEQRIVLEIKSGGSQMDELLVQMLRKYIRVNGGTVQTVLGK
jgi:hypothetical protein